MGRLAGVALTTASIMLIVVAVPLNSAALFYMSTAMIATMIASRIQAARSVKKLKIERFAPEIARVGELVTIDLTLWTETPSRRPLITLVDHLPEGMVLRDLTPTLPIAPALGHPVQTHYSFRPMRRGKYRWSKLTAIGSDALGLVAAPREYAGTEVALTVLPSPLPISFDLNAAAGWGFTETEHGRGRGLGIQPRGVREYVSGDALRYVHWPSTAKRGELLVKEFETGSQASVAFFPQMTVGSDLGVGAQTSLEHMCSNLAYLTGWLMRQGVEVEMPPLEKEAAAPVPSEREHQMLMALAEVQADSEQSLGFTLQEHLRSLPGGAHVCLLMSVPDPSVPGAISEAIGKGHSVSVLVYDANVYPRPKGRKDVDSAASKPFVDHLRGAGAQVSFVSGGGGLL